MPEPIRILELRSVKGTGGGPDKTILLGAARADRSRFAVTVAYLRDARDDAFAIDAAARRAGVDYVEVVERHSADVSVVPALRRLIRHRRIDIVHAHDYKTDLLALLLARVEDVIPLSTAHGWSGHGWLERRLYYPVDKRLLRAFPAVIVVSSDMRQMLVRAGVPLARIVVLRNGIDHVAYRRNTRLQHAARLELGYGPELFAIGAVGRLEREKRYDLLIDACVRVARTRPNVRLVIAGEGAMRASLEAQIARVDERRTCRLLGHCSDVVRLHHGLDLMVQTSDNEGSPNAVLEAMALRTPVVATAVGGTGELIRDGVEGLLVGRGNVDALVLAIQSCLDDRAGAARRATAARARVERDLSFDARQQTLESIYEDLVSRSPSRRDAAPDVEYA